MSKLVRSRRLIALFAAYVVALQAFLLPLTVAAFAAPESVLCTTAGETAPQPTNHDTGCACAAGCGLHCSAPALMGPPPQGAIVSRATPGVVVAPLPATLVSMAPSEGTPHSPRAPPSV